MEAEEAKKGGGEGEIPPSPRLFRDIRRYYCEFCGICRSKKSLIATHIRSQHQDEIGDAGSGGDEQKPSSYACEECGASFRKPAYLRQHMQGHSIERPFICPVDDCHHSYRRKDHLTRHLLQHQGKLFTCPKESCNRRFSIRSNMQRHVKELHDEESPAEDQDHPDLSSRPPRFSGRGRDRDSREISRESRDMAFHAEDRAEKKYICPEIGCGKEFKYLSRLKKHEDSHVKLEYVEVICGEPGCMKHFTNAECLKVHRKSCHQHVQCPTCGTQQLKKNLKRHLCIHANEGASGKIKCSFPRCLHSFSKKSNLMKHVKAVHFELRPFTCRMSGCGLKFPYKHVRDNHERCGVHTFVQGDFLEVDEQVRSKPRGGRKRKSVMVELLLRKRIAASPDEINMMQNGTRRMSQILGDGQEDGTSD